MYKPLSTRLIIVSNRLPFQLVKRHGKGEMRESDGGLVSALKSYFDNPQQNHGFTEKPVWIGSAEFNENLWANTDKEQLNKLHYQVEPIFIDKKNYDRYYNGFCNATLWPLFHYFPSFVEFDNHTFKAYEEVNQLFATKINSVLRPGDIVWVHDYQLMLLPGMIREQHSDAAVGFFLHIPFPSFELFRLLHQPWKEKILSGLLGADLIGFHTHGYVQHFLKSVQMVKGYDHRFRSLFLPDRTIKAEMFPLGIDYNKFHDAHLIPEVIEQRVSIENSFHDRKIIFSVDRLDYTKGITHRLAGFERFLEQYPEWREKVIFILVVVPSRQIVSKYNERKKLIEEEIGRINGMYSTLQWQPIIYRYNQMSFNELTAMYHIAHIGLITPLRDGMNLVAKEYVASKTDKGVLILSELAGAASELSEAVLVNPMDKDAMSEAILTSLLMPSHEQQLKIKLMQQRLKDYTVSDWIQDFLKQLEESKEQQRIRQTNLFSAKDFKVIANHYSTANRRLLLLDYDGTLVPFTKHPALAMPNQKLVQLLTRLASDIRTDLTIVSGRDSGALEKWFGALSVNLVSEHGAGIRMKDQEWKYFVDIDQSWKTILRPLLDTFSRRSPGSFVEDKTHTLVWHYRNVETELGFIRSRELLDSLQHLVHNSHLSIIDGNKVIEIRVSGIDKGAVTKKIMDMHSYDFILAIGDDKTDEDMFRMLEDKAYTIKVGASHTSAKYYVADQDAALQLLSQLMAVKENVLS